MIVLALAAGAWLAFSLLYRSEREKVMATVTAVRDGVVEGDVEKVLSRVSPRFHEPGLGREQLAAVLRRRLQERPVRWAIVRRSDVEIRDGLARARVIFASSQLGRPATSQWQIELEKTDGGWLVLSATPVLINDEETAGLHSVIRRR